MSWIPLSENKARLQLCLAAATATTAHNLLKSAWVHSLITGCLWMPLPVLKAANRSGWTLPPVFEATKITICETNLNYTLAWHRCTSLSPASMLHEGHFSKFRHCTCWPFAGSQHNKAAGSPLNWGQQWKGHTGHTESWESQHFKLIIEYSFKNKTTPFRRLYESVLVSNPSCVLGNKPGNVNQLEMFPR